MKKTILYLLITFILYSCCPPASKITNGEALRKWEHKHKFRSAENFRVMWINKTGPVYKVRFANMKSMFNQVYYEKLPGWCIEGNWIPIDSICKS
jgi:hypothetical protein